MSSQCFLTCLAYLLPSRPHLLQASSVVDNQFDGVIPELYI